jgi:hypothetical protein
MKVKVSDHTKSERKSSTFESNDTISHSIQRFMKMPHAFPFQSPFWNRFIQLWNSSLLKAILTSFTENQVGGLWHWLPARMIDDNRESKVSRIMSESRGKIVQNTNSYAKHPIALRSPTFSRESGFISLFKWSSECDDDSVVQNDDLSAFFGDNSGKFSLTFVVNQPRWKAKSLTIRYAENQSFWESVTMFLDDLSSFWLQFPIRACWVSFHRESLETWAAIRWSLSELFVSF